MSTSAHAVSTPLVDEKQIEEYLLENPDFFHTHLDLLEEMHVPHPSGVAISLVERQLSLLREKNQVLEKRLYDLVTAARENENLISRLHRLSLELMHADCLDAVVSTCQEVLRTDFNADNVVLRLIGEGDNAEGLHFISPKDKSLKNFETLFEKRSPVCGRLRPKQQLFLFGEKGNKIKSAVLIPLHEAKNIGVLALGSEDEARFHPGMGTLFIGYLGELVSRTLVKYMD